MMQMLVVRRVHDRKTLGQKRRCRLFANKVNAANLLRNTWQFHLFDKGVKGRVCLAAYKELIQRCRDQQGSFSMNDDVYIENK